MEAVLKMEELIQLEEYATYMLSVKEIAFILGLPVAELHALVTDETTIEYNHFTRGRIKAKASINKSIYDLALNGNSTSQAQFLDLIKKADLLDGV